jgi:hypothetical protein
MRFVGKVDFPKAKDKPKQPSQDLISPPGELMRIGFVRVLVTNPCLPTNALDMKECDAPVSNKTTAGMELTRNVPVTASGAS